MIPSLRAGRGAVGAVTALMVALALAVGLALVPISVAHAADKGQVSVEPVTFDGTTYKGTDPKGPFSTAHPKGLDKSDPDSATAELDDTVKPGTTYPWGSVGAKNGSFIQNKTGKDICKIVITATDGGTFDTAPLVGGGWTAEVSKDKKTITFTAKDAKSCVKDGGWFWMKVPKSPQPGSGTPPTLEGSFAALTPDPSGETAVVALTTDDAFISSLFDIDAAIAMQSPTPSPSDTAVTPTSPPASPPSSSNTTVAPTPTGSASVPTPLPTLVTTSASSGAGL